MTVFKLEAGLQPVVVDRIVRTKREENFHFFNGAALGSEVKIFQHGLFVPGAGVVTQFVVGWAGHVLDVDVVGGGGVHGAGPGSDGAGVVAVFGLAQVAEFHRESDRFIFENRGRPLQGVGNIQ